MPVTKWKSGYTRRLSSACFETFALNNSIAGIDFGIIIVYLFVWLAFDRIVAAGEMPAMAAVKAGIPPVLLPSCQPAVRELSQGERKDEHKEN